MKDEPTSQEFSDKREAIQQTSKHMNNLIGLVNAQWRLKSYNDFTRFRKCPLLIEHYEKPPVKSKHLYGFSTKQIKRKERWCGWNSLDMETKDQDSTR